MYFIRLINTLYSKSKEVHSSYHIVVTARSVSADIHAFIGNVAYYYKKQQKNKQNDKKIYLINFKNNEININNN